MIRQKEENMENNTVNKETLRGVYAKAIEKIDAEIEAEAENVMNSALGFCVKAAEFANTEITLPRNFFANGEDLKAIEIRHRVLKKLRARDLTISVDELSGDITISW